MSGSVATSIPWKRDGHGKGARPLQQVRRPVPRAARGAGFGVRARFLDVNFGPRDVIQTNSTGFLVPFRDREAAIRAVTLLLTDDALCEEMSLNAFNVAKNYTGDAIFEQWIHALGFSQVQAIIAKGHVRYESKAIRNSIPPDGTMEIEIGTELAGLELDGLELVISERGNPDAQPVKCVPYMENEGTFDIPRTDGFALENPRGRPP